MSYSEDVTYTAREIVSSALIEGGDFPDRSVAGDVFFGAIAAGATDDAAHEIAVSVHLSHSKRVEMERLGGLTMGAAEHLLRSDDG